MGPTDPPKPTAFQSLAAALVRGLFFHRVTVLGVEMEAAELYTLAARYGRRALAVLTVSDHLQTGEALPSADREQTFGDMVEIALEAAVS